MNITLDEAAKEKVLSYLDKDKLLLLTFEDGVGAYSQQMRPTARTTTTVHQ